MEANFGPLNLKKVKGWILLEAAVTTSMVP